jgi:hypothetical protein
VQALSYYGSGISLTDRDFVGLYRFSLGNIGYDRSVQNYATTSRCGSLSPEMFHASVNATCVPIYSFFVPLDVATGAITIFELLQILVFSITGDGDYR